MILTAGPAEHDAASSRISVPLGIAIALLAAKLWLVSGQRMTAIGPDGHDDHLFLNLAGNLIHGRWLGPFDRMTLIKGPFYPMWIAASFAAGIPLMMSQQMLYAGACALFVAAISPALRSSGMRLALFASLLFCPITFADGAATRVLREEVYASLTLLVLGTALRLVLRLDDGRSVRWAVGLGASFAAFWLCREEHVWIVPALLAIAAWAFLRFRRRALRPALQALALAAALVGAVALINGLHYGEFVITEFTAGPWPRAYAALTRVEHEHERPRVFLPAETRLRIYRVSPAFAELRPFLEGDIGRGWIKPGCDEFGICDEIGPAWVMWALRDAAEAAGHYREGREAARYWSAVASEVSDACSSGLLRCRAWSPGFLPALHASQFAAFGQSVLQGLRLLIRYDGVTPHPSPSMGPAFLLTDFRDIARARLMPAPGIEEPATPRQDRLEATQERILDGVVGGYRYFMTIFAIPALIGLAAMVLARRFSPLVIISAVLATAAASRLLLLAAIQAIAFNALNLWYLAAAYPLSVASIILLLASAVDAWRGRKNCESGRTS